MHISITERPQTAAAPPIAKNGRIEWIDFAKAIGIFWIVLGHALSGSMVREFIYAFHVPLFFLLSGITFKSNASYGTFLLKKVRTLLVPYCLFMAVSIVIFYFMGSVAADSLGKDVQEFSWANYILGSLYGNSKSGYLRANMPLWFLPCLFVVENLMYFITKLLPSDKENARRKALLITLAGCCALMLLNHYVLHINRLPFALETALHMLPFALVGYGLHAFRLPTLSKPVKAITSAAAIAVCFILGCFANSTVDVRNDAYGNYLIYLIAASCGILGFCLLSTLIPSNRFLSYIGQNTLIILLLHKFPILFFQVLFTPTATLMKTNHLPVCILVSAASIAMCLAAGAVIMKIAPWMLGKRCSKATKEIQK